MQQDYAEKLAREAAIIVSAAEMFCIAPGAMVKVRKWNGPWVPMRLDELLNRMKHPKPRMPERNESETQKKDSSAIARWSA
jgi:hypothetical protein